jgi:hypothetical protein
MWRTSFHRRIESIMTPRLARQLQPGKKSLLALFSIAAIAVPIAIGMLHPSRIRAESQPQTAAPLFFEVASVKLRTAMNTAHG